MTKLGSILLTCEREFANMSSGDWPESYWFDYNGFYDIELWTNNGEELITVYILTGENQHAERHYTFPRMIHVYDTDTDTDIVSYF